MSDGLLRYIKFTPYSLLPSNTYDQVWRNNFQAIGGPLAAQTHVVVDLESAEALFCGICNFQCKNRRQFITRMCSSSYFNFFLYSFPHLRTDVTSSKHKEEEKYLMEN
jgi:hypothetical protein